MSLGLIPFKADGVAVISNAIAFEVQIDRENDVARVRDGNNVAPWRTIQESVDEQGPYEFIEHRDFELDFRELIPA